MHVSSSSSPSSSSPPSLLQEFFAIKITANVPATRKEHSLLGRMDHPNIVRVHGMQQSSDGQILFIILDLCGGGELFDHIVRGQGGHLPEQRARRFFVDLVRGVAHCHGHGVAHRDLKPENLLISQDGVLRLADFGLAFNTRAAAAGVGADKGEVKHGEEEGAAMDAQSLLAHTQAGSQFYVAPEICTKAALSTGYDAKLSDIWSCGVILYCMLMGTPPFNLAVAKDARFAALAKGKISWPVTGVSQGARALIQRILTVPPKGRPSLDDILADPWCQGETAVAKLVGAAAQPGPASYEAAVATFQGGVVSGGRGGGGGGEAGAAAAAAAAAAAGGTGSTPQDNGNSSAKRVKLNSGSAAAAAAATVATAATAVTASSSSSASDGEGAASSQQHHMGQAPVPEEEHVDEGGAVRSGAVTHQLGWGGIQLQVEALVSRVEETLKKNLAGSVPPLNVARRENMVFVGTEKVSAYVTAIPETSVSCRIVVRPWVAPNVFDFHAVYKSIRAALTSVNGGEAVGITATMG